MRRKPHFPLSDRRVREALRCWVYWLTFWMMAPVAAFVKWVRR